jgi:hypothetical protein
MDHIGTFAGRHTAGNIAEGDSVAKGSVRRPMSILSLSLRRAFPVRSMDRAVARDVDVEGYLRRRSGTSSIHVAAPAQNLETPEGASDLHGQVVYP